MKRVRCMEGGGGICNGFEKLNRGRMYTSSVIVMSWDVGHSHVSACHAAAVAPWPTFCQLAIQEHA